MTVELISSLAKFQSLKNEPFEIKLVDAILEAKLSDVVMRGKDPAGQGTYIPYISKLVR